MTHLASEFILSVLTPKHPKKTLAGLKAATNATPCHVIMCSTCPVPPRPAKKVSPVRVPDESPTPEGLDDDADMDISPRLTWTSHRGLFFLLGNPLWMVLFFGNHVFIFVVHGGQPKRLSSGPFRATGSKSSWFCHVLVLPPGLAFRRRKVRLLRHHTQHFDGDAIELIEACPGTSTARRVWSFKKQSRGARLGSIFCINAL